MVYFPHLFCHFIICFSLFSFTQNMGAMGRNSNETDRLALLAFKAKVTYDPLGMTRLWNNSIHLCEWYGVTCSVRHQRVTQLNLQSLKLGGSISPHVGNLSFLRVLQLQNNSFSHQIPLEIGRLRRLRVLELRNNSLGGEIPLNLSFCSELISLSLHNNILRGEIPPQLGSLSRLRYFGASINHLTGALPSSLGNLTFLENFFVAYNKLGGRIPITLGSLSNLRRLSITENDLSRQVPNSIFNLTYLESIDISYNQLEGQLPTNMFNRLPKLLFLSNMENQFTGPIPSSLSNASNMQVFQIGGNQHTGKVPWLGRLSMLWHFFVPLNQLGSGYGAQDDLSFLCSMTNATNLQVLEMNENMFGGMLPGCITNLSSSLIALTIYKNYISGSIPPGIDNLKGLQVLIVNTNPLTGTIPPSIGNLENLSLLQIGDNKLSGPIPSSFGKLSKLISLVSGPNNLEGTIPSSLQNCTSLQYLVLEQNNLTGFIPPQILSLPSLTIGLYVSNNQLTGPLPEEVGKLQNINKLVFSSNRLSGKIPDSLGDCASLQYLHLDGNNFQGPIPSSLGSLKGLQMLDLSSNNLSGQIPQVLASLDLIMLNLSFNDLEGAVPTNGVFKNSSATSLKGNNKLCGGMPVFHLPRCSSSIPRRNSKKKKLSAKAKLLIAIVVALASLATLILILLVVFGLRWKRRQTRKALVAAPLINQPLQFVSYGDLYRATNGFSETNLVGAGNFGHVYRGIIGEGGQVVAIKVLNLKRHGASKSFNAECEALRNIRHRNLVKLLTVCSGVDYQGNEFKALVYEFMPNGSLEDWLHHSTMREVEDEGHEQHPSRKLGLLERLSIAIDVASILEYVHHEFGTPLVHSDIKPSNILLDGDLCGHVSDFGLAKFLSDTGIILSSVHPSSSTGVRGTIGYAPPEYGLGSEVSTQGDVYSYGILLLEMVTGKRPTHEMFIEGLSLHLYAKMALSNGRNGVINILDPILRDVLETEVQLVDQTKSVRLMDLLGQVIEIGVECSNDSPTERMDISTVTSKLRKIRDNLSSGLDKTKTKQIRVPY